MTGDPPGTQPLSTGKLHRYALGRLAAARYPGASHPFRLLGCAACGVAPLRLTVEHHTGSRRTNFRGQIMAQCSRCGESQRIYSFTGAHRKPERQETPHCPCGNDAFYVAECERIERDEGMPGFADEGVVVGQCAACGRHIGIIETD